MRGRWTAFGCWARARSPAPITITVSGASATAKAAVEEAGGTVTTTVVPKVKEVAEKAA